MTANGSSTYYRGGVMVYDGDNLSYMLHPEGTISYLSGQYTYNYFLKDHVGSTRKVLAVRSDNTVDEIQSTDYYPFGLAYSYDDLHQNKYLFGGKELQDGTVNGKPVELYDFHARFYDPFIARWMRQDPLARRYASLSPYSYCANNPIRFIDPNGMSFRNAADSMFGGLYAQDLQSRMGFNDQEMSRLRDERRSAMLSGNNDLAQGFQNTINELQRYGFLLSNSHSEYQQMLESKTHTFGFEFTTNAQGFISKDTDGNYIIHYTDMANLVHEAKHGYQIMTDTENRWAYSTKEGMMVMKIGDLKRMEYAANCEIAAYRAQYAFDFRTLGFSLFDDKFVPLNSIEGINVKWLVDMGYTWYQPLLQK